MISIFKTRFKDSNYIADTGFLDEKKLLAVNHICIHEDCTLFNDIVIPFGAKDIEEKSTFVIDEILHELVHFINNKENINKKIIICGSEKSKRMLGRKLEDKLKKEISY